MRIVHRLDTYKLDKKVIQSWKQKNANVLHTSQPSDKTGMSGALRWFKTRFTCRTTVPPSSNTSVTNTHRMHFQLHNQPPNPQNCTFQISMKVYSQQIWWQCSAQQKFIHAPSTRLAATRAIQPTEFNSLFSLIAATSVRDFADKCFRKNPTALRHWVMPGLFPLKGNWIDAHSALEVSSLLKATLLVFSNTFTFRESAMKKRAKKSSLRSRQQW